MAGIEPLMSTNHLKTTYLRQKPPALHVKYDTAFDAFTLLLVPPETETIVHYLDNYVAFLYEPDTKEIVGIQIEAFERKFLPKHEAVRRVWKLSDACPDLQDVGGMILAVERITPKVAWEVAKATEDILGEPGQELAAMLEHIKQSKISFLPLIFGEE
jgi:hypothetical protein